MKEIYKLIIDQEKQLHLHANRTNNQLVSQLLDKDFLEIWYSWKTHNFNSTLNDLSKENEIIIVSKKYNCSIIDDNTILVLYESANLESWEYSRFAKRSSIWIKDENNWKLRFHQATAVLEFSL
jgi:ribonuclease HI